jgi:hypothetical protein
VPRGRSAVVETPSANPNDAPVLQPQAERGAETTPQSALPHTRAIALDASAPPPSAAWHTRLVQLLATGALLSIGALLLWLAPSPPAPEAPLPTPSQKARPIAKPAAIAPATVHLRLHGLPDDATVTLDGQPASGDLVLARDARAHALVVTAPNQTPWHVSYVANADQILEVQLEPLVPPPSAAGKAKRATTRAKPRNREALRVPDF